MGPETKNSCAAEGQKKFTGLDCYVSIYFDIINSSPKIKINLHQLHRSGYFIVFQLSM
jgi:hypothetical protein